MVDLGKINLPRSNSWYYDNGYLTIDLELFGKYLSIIFSKILGNCYCFQTFNPKIQTTTDIPIWEQDKEEREMAIISSVLYDDSSIKNYNEIRTTYARSSKPNCLVPYNIYYKEYDTLFSKDPLELGENDFLLYFGINSCNDTKLTLGYVEDEKFVCHNFSNVGTKEVKYNNPQYSFIDDFAKAIFYYKIVNSKPNIDENDVESILIYFGITRKEIIEQFLNILKNVEQISVETLLSCNNVENTLKLIKIKK